MELLFRLAPSGNEYICTGISPNNYDKPVVIPDEVDGIPVCRIDAEAFKLCALPSIHIPASVTYIPRGAFLGCVNLTEVTFGEGSRLLEVGTSAFYGCGYENTLHIRFPETMQHIGHLAFCESKVELLVHQDCENDSTAFQTTRGKVKYYGETAFSAVEEDECKNKFRLNKDRTGYVLVEVGSQYDDTVTVPDSFNGLPVVELGYHALSVPYTKFFHIPATVVKSHDQPFYGCDNLWSVRYDGTTGNWKKMNIYCWETVYCSDGKIEEDS